MIDIYQNRIQTTRNQWARTIRNRFCSLELETHVLAEDILASLAEFCREHPYVSETNLSLLMARSFCIAGDVDAADRVLQSDYVCHHHSDAWIDVLKMQYPFPELFPLFSSGIFRPIDLESVGRVWVLDLDKVKFSDGDFHEIILFQALRVLVGKASSVWEETDGKGVLGIKGLKSVSEFLNLRNFSDSMLKHIRGVFSKCASKNRWSTTPIVLQIDL